MADDVRAAVAAQTHLIASKLGPDWNSSAAWMAAANALIDLIANFADVIDPRHLSLLSDAAAMSYLESFLAGGREARS